MTDPDPRSVAARALPLVDLTDLRDECDTASIDALCARAQTPRGNTAAICIWPRFVAHARALLGAGHPVRIATVVNFPSGALEIATVVAETEGAIADGADEIDLVMPWKALIAGNDAAVRDMVSSVHRVCAGRALLKVILETGELKDPSLIREASDIAIAAGADFIKTSTGKVAVNATTEAARIMLEAIRDSGRTIGFKPAGGIGNVGEAARYLDLAEMIVGPSHISPATFRFGASGLLDDIMAVLEGHAPRRAAGGY